MRLQLRGDWGATLKLDVVVLSGDKEAQRHALRDNAKYYTMVNDYIDSAPPEAHFAKTKPRAHGTWKEYSYYNEGRTCDPNKDIYSEELCPRGRFAGKVTKGQPNYLWHADEPTVAQYAFHPDILGEGERDEEKMRGGRRGFLPTRIRTTPWGNIKSAGNVLYSPCILMIS